MPSLPPPQMPGSPREDAAAPARGSGDNSSFSSPLPPCPEDPPAPPPPSCTPPKYQPVEENENENENTEDDRDEADSVEGEEVEQQTLPTPPPPPPSPPIASPLGTPPPPPPPYSPPSASKINLDLSDALQTAERRVEADARPAIDTREESQRYMEGMGQENGEEGDAKEGREDAAGLSTPSPSSSSSSVIAAMRVAAREREILAADFVREPPPKRSRFYIGDIENYSIIDKVGSGTYGYVSRGGVLHGACWDWSDLHAQIAFVQ